MQIDHALLAASWRSWHSSDLAVVGPGWLQLLWTFLFNFAIGLGFFVVGLSAQLIGGESWPAPDSLLQQFLGDQVLAQVIGFVIHGLFAVAIPLTGAQRIRAFGSTQRALFFAGIPLLGVMIGWPLGALLLGAGPQLGRLVERPGALGGMFVLALLLCFVVYQHFDAKARQFEAEKRAAEAQLRLLQGQIEPHFMFNTLANVLSLIEVDAPKARQMLEAFTDYLRASLGKLREGDSTLGEELAMSQAYLALMQSRMGDRLAFRFDIADTELRRARLPPLLLQPLVENAVHHGLESKVEGGTVTVSARRDGPRLVLQVSDDGLGERATAARRTGGPTNGVALDNLRARLHNRWGSAAQLTLEVQRDTGARATLTLPLETAA